MALAVKEDGVRARVGYRWMKGRAGGTLGGWEETSAPSEVDQESLAPSELGHRG